MSEAVYAESTEEAPVEQPVEAPAEEESADEEDSDEDSGSEVQPEGVVWGGTHALRIPHPDGGFVGLHWNGVVKHTRG